MFPVKEEPPGYSAASGASCTESESDAVGIKGGRVPGAAQSKRATLEFIGAFQSTLASDNNECELVKNKLFIVSVFTWK